MSINMRLYNFFILFTIVILIILPYTHADTYEGDSSGWTPDGDSKKVTEKDLDKLEDEGGIKGVKAENVEKTPDGNYRITSGGYTKGGVDYGGKNIVVSSDGEIVRADSLDVDGNHFENVQDFKRLSNGRYEVERADYLQDNGRKIIKGGFITGGEEQMEAEQAETVQDDEAVASSVIDYSSDDDKFSVGEAKAVVVDNSVFSDIKQSSFETEDGDLVKANVTSNTDNNSFEVDGVEVTLNEGDSAELVKQDNGKYDITTDIGESDWHVVNNLSKAPDNANVERLDNGSWNVTTQVSGLVEDNYGKVACVNLDPGTRYEYTGDDYKAFGLFIPPDADNFNLCMRTKENEQYPTNCSQCGVMDFVNQSFVLNGNYEYERKDAVDPRLFTDVIKADGNFSGNLSENAEDITHLYPGLGQVFSNIFEVKYWQEDEGFRFASFNKPHTILNIYPNIKITKQKLTYTAPTNKFIMHKSMPLWSENNINQGGT